MTPPIGPDAATSPPPHGARRGRPWPAVFGAIAASAATMLVLDLVWLGVVAKPLYDSSLGALRRDPVFVPAALLFYAMYLGAVLLHAVLPSQSAAEAAKRGAGLGFVAYATYELTNWAVLASWPPLLVPVDTVWGVVLTAITATAGFLAAKRADRAR